jgi:AraC-like DNA-binding protein
MSIFESRESDSPYIERLWRGQTGENYSPVCPADVRWNMLFRKSKGKVQVSIEGPLTKATPKFHPDAAEFLVIKFRLGAFMPYFPIGEILDADILLPEALRHGFWMNSDRWEIPDFENTESFVDKLVHHGLLVWDTVVNESLQGQSAEMSERTVRRHFLRATGLNPKSIEQIERANQALALLTDGTSISDTAFDLGYADQAHLTRSMRRFVGNTPAQILRQSQVE